MKTRTELLTAQSRYDLADLCMRMGIEPAPKGETKAATAGRLIAAMDGDLKSVRQSLGLSCLQALREAVGRKKGELTLPLANPDPDLADALDLLRHFGLAWRDRSRWYLLPEVRSLTSYGKNEENELEICMHMLQHVTLGLNRYGVAPIDVVMGPEDSGNGDRDMLRLTMLTMFSRYHGLSGFIPGPDGKLWMRSQDCEDPAETLVRQIACGQRGVEWPPNALDDVYAYGEAAVPLDERAMSILRELLPHLSDADPDLVVECLEDAFFLLQENDREGALENLCDIFTDEEYTDARRWLMDRLLNHLPIWGLKGHTISDLNKGKILKEYRLKPGDPCPCGSGRTWGKCHGRIN